MTKHPHIPSEPVGQAMICSACGYGLEGYEQWVGNKLVKISYAHGYLPPDIDPHHEIAPIPRPDDNAEVKGVCDFCIAPDPIWTYPAKSFHLDVAELQEPGATHTQSYGSVGDWGACQRCYEDIEADRWDDIMERNLQSDAIRQMEPIKTLLKAKLADMYKGFRLHRTGPAYREADGPPVQRD
jgi:hypothetical protein